MMMMMMMMMMLNILFLPVTHQAWVEFHNWPAYPRDLVVIIKVFRFRLKLWTIYNAKKGKDTPILFYGSIRKTSSFFIMYIAYKNRKKTIIDADKY